MGKITKIVIFYFSGTGNAKQIAVWFSEFAVNNKIDCQIFNIEKTNGIIISSIEETQLILIISPVHGFNFPLITINFILDLPKGKNCIVLMNTRAGMKMGSYITPGLTGISFMLSSLILRTKGYKIVGQIPFDMPSNWISVHPALNENTMKFLFKKNYERVEKHSKKIFSGKSDFLSHRDLVQDLLISPFSFAYFFFGRFAFAKSFFASGECDKCRLCVKQCPLNAIKIVDGRPYWTFNCESCMKCMNHCPKKAIETAHGLFATISVLCFVLTTILLYNILNICIQSSIIRISVFSLVFLLLIWPFYKIQHLLLKNKFLGNLISFTSLTHYKIWGRYIKN